MHGKDQSYGPAKGFCARVPARAVYGDRARARYAVSRKPDYALVRRVEVDLSLNPVRGRDGE